MGVSGRTCLMVQPLNKSVSNKPVSNKPVTFFL